MFVIRPRGIGTALVVLTLLAAVAGPVPAADLFTPVDAPPPPLPAADLTLRSRVVSMDLGQVQAAQAAVAAPPAHIPRTPAAVTALPGSVPRTPTPPVHPASADAAPAPGTTLTFNLFADTVVTARVEQTAPTFSGGYSIAGHIVGEPLGTMTLVVNGETVVGTVRLVGETYHIRSVGEGLYTVSEVEEPPLNCGVDEFHSETDHLH